MALISRSYFLQVSATWFSIWEYANHGSFLTETCSAGNTVCVVLLLQLCSWLCIWVMDNCCNFHLGNNKTDMYYCITMYMFGCSSFPSYFTVFYKTLVTLKQCYQTDGQKNEMTGAKSMWVILGWFIYHDSINHQLYPSSSVSLHRLKRWKKASIWGVDWMKGQIWWEFVRSNGDVLFWVIWRIAFYPRWLNSRQGDIDQMSHLFLFLSYYTFTSFSFFFFWKETLWISWFI